MQSYSLVDFGPKRGPEKRKGFAYGATYRLMGAGDVIIPLPPCREWECEHTTEHQAREHYIENLYEDVFEEGLRKLSLTTYLPCLVCGSPANTGWTGDGLIVLPGCVVPPGCAHSTMSRVFTQHLTDALVHDQEQGKKPTTIGDVLYAKEPFPRGEGFSDPAYRSAYRRRRAEAQKRNGHHEPDQEVY